VPQNLKGNVAVEARFENVPFKAMVEKTVFML
jgi:hypothetical protein